PRVTIARSGTAVELAHVAEAAQDKGAQLRRRCWQVVRMNDQIVKLAERAQYERGGKPRVLRAEHARLDAISNHLFESRPETGHDLLTHAVVHGAVVGTVDDFDEV